MKITRIILPLLVIFYLGRPSSHAQQFNSDLQKYMESLPGEFSKISPERQEKLKSIANYISMEWLAKKEINPLFICTHNSRRSIMSQVWLATAASYYKVTGVTTYSGGTEATAFNIRAVNALKRAGFTVQKEESEPSNPRYQVLISKQVAPITCYSKKYDAPANPQEGFFAIMVCSDADAACPVVHGADKRFSLPYDDPRLSDKTPSEEKTYDERCRQIAREMFFVMSQVNSTIREKEKQR